MSSPGLTPDRSAVCRAPLASSQKQGGQRQQQPPAQLSCLTPCCQCLPVARTGFLTQEGCFGTPCLAQIHSPNSSSEHLQCTRVEFRGLRGFKPAVPCGLQRIAWQLPVWGCPNTPFLPSSRVRDDHAVAAHWAACCWRLNLWLCGPVCHINSTWHWLLLLLGLPGGHGPASKSQVALHCCCLSICSLRNCRPGHLG